MSCALRSVSRALLLCVPCLDALCPVLCCSVSCAVQLCVLCRAALCPVLCRSACPVLCRSACPVLCCSVSCALLLCSKASPSVFFPPPPLGKFIFIIHSPYNISRHSRKKSHFTFTFINWHLKRSKSTRKVNESEFFTFIHFHTSFHRKQLHRQHPSVAAVALGCCGSSTGVLLK